MSAALALLLVIVAVLLWFIMAYNSLVQTRNAIDNAWSQIDVQLKRRHDLIPNLVETTKGYMTHERETLESVTQARLAAMNATGVVEKSAAESLLGNTVGRLLAVAESYPELKANQNFLALQEELTSTENRIAFARQAYNDAVLFLNNKLQTIPSNWVAGMFGFTSRPYLQIENPAEREVPKVSFGR